MRIASRNMTVEPISRAAAIERRVPVAVVLAMLGACVDAGLDSRSALEAVGLAVGGPEGAELAAVARRLSIGIAWDQAWSDVPDRWMPVARTLRVGLTSGASPVLALAAAADALMAKSRADGERAAAEMGVRLALPLAVCLLPAFVLAGIIPLLITLGGGLFDAVARSAIMIPANF